MARKWRAFDQGHRGLETMIPYALPSWQTAERVSSWVEEVRVNWQERGRVAQTTCRPGERPVPVCPVR